MSISAIIPVYNVTEYLSQTLDSLLDQNFAKLQIIIVDDGSDKGPARTIARIAKRYDAQLIKQQNKGTSIARQTGLKHAKGEFVLFIDADDILLSGALTHLHQALKDHPQAIASYGTKVQIDENGNFLHKAIVPSPEMAVSGDVLPALLKGKPLLSNGSVLIRRKSIAAVTFPEGIRHGEDWVTWCRLAMMGDIIHADGRVVLAIRVHAANVSSEVLRGSAAFMPMFHAVFEDSAMIECIGKERLKAYRSEHLQVIHQYLRWQNKEQGNPIRSYIHRLLSRYWKARIPRKIRVLHVVKWFYAGGAERLLSGVIEHSDRDKFEHHVLSLSSQGERIAEVQHKFNVGYYAVEMTRNKRNLMAWLKCALYILKTRPDVMKTWLPPSNIAGGKLGKWLGIPVIWGIHDAQPTTPEHAEKTQQLELSHRLPKHIVCCSQPVLDQCVKDGYNPSLLSVIDNGTDTARFDHRKQKRKQLRATLGIKPSTLVIGMAAECTPIKRHPYFLEAAKAFLEIHPDTRFLLCGQGVSTQNPALQELIEQFELKEHVLPLGIQNDMTRFYSALDIHTLCSENESFGLANSEAMACKTFCVATHVGIMPELLQDIGEVILVDPDPQKLVQAWATYLKLSSKQKTARTEQGRKRVIDCYSLQKTAQQYDSTYEANIAHSA